MQRLAILFILVAITVGLLVASRFRKPSDKVSGFIESDQVRVGSRVGGRIAKVHVQEGQTVSQGQLLITLDPFDLEERLAEAKANRAARVAAYEKLKSGLRPEEIAQAKAKAEGLAATVAKLEAGPRAEEIAAAESRLTLAQAQLERASRTNDRIQTLYNRDPANVSRDDVDRAEEEFKVTDAAYRVRSEELQLLKRGTREEEKAEARAQLEQAKQALQMAEKGFRQEEIAEAEAAVAAASAGVAAVEASLQELEVRSGVNGVVEALELRPGDLVAPGSPILSIIDTSRKWVRVYVPENRLNIAIDDRLRVTVDSFVNQSFEGHVTYIATQAEFTPRNVQTPEERAKQVFRIKVELNDPKDVLRAGMAADVWLGS